MSQKKPMMNNFKIYSTTTPYFCNFSANGCDYHCHTDFYEFCLIAGGTYRNTYNGEDSIYGIGNLLFFRPGECHTFISNEQNSHHYAILIEEKFFKDYCQKHMDNADDILSTSHVFRRISGPQLAYLTQLTSILQHSASADRLSIINQFLSSALFACFEDLPAMSADTISLYTIDLLHRLDSYQILSENVADIYRDYPVSQAFLINDFKRLTGHTIVHYRNLKRMEYAAHLLVAENYSVTAVADILNVSSLGHFSQQFKKQYGHSPKQYQLL